MGAHYGSIQIRSTDQKAVVKSVETIARARNIKCLVGPAFNGWVGVYPESNGQDDAVGADIAKEFGGTAIHVLIHDDDVMAYWLWRDGQLCDSYYSKPGYFGEAQRAKEESMAGTPEQFESIIGEKTEALKEILRRDRKVGALESERLDDFAKLLGITNALTAYEYLKEEECEGVKGRRKFQEVPGDLARAEAEQKKQERQAANKQAREKRRRVEAWRSRMQASGLLLLRSEFAEWGIQTCAIEGGFVVARPDPAGLAHLEFCGPPWHELQPVGVQVPGFFRALCVDEEGHHVGIGAGRQAMIFQVTDGHWSKIAETTLDENVWCMALSNRAVHMACAGEGAITVLETASGRKLREIPTENAASLYMHPDGRHLVAILRCGKLLLIDVAEKGESREIFVGGKSPAPRGFGVVRSAFKEFDINALISQQQRNMEDALSQLRAMFEKASKKAKGSPEANVDMAQIRRDLERQNEWQIKRLREFNANRGVVHVPMEHASSCAFTGDGRFLCITTNKSFRVFNWEQFLQSGEVTPAPVWRIYFNERQPIYAITPEVDHSAVLFAQGSKICRLDLVTGNVENLLENPGTEWTAGLVFSKDGSVLAMSRQSRLGSRTRKKTPSAWEIWSYPEFRERARFSLLGKS